MGYSTQAAVFLVVCLLWGTHGFLSFEDLSRSSDPIYFKLGSQLRSLGIPEIKVTEENDENDLPLKVFSLNYGNNRYIRAFVISRHGPLGSFLSKIEFNLFNIKGTFKGKQPPKNSHKETEDGIRFTFLNYKGCPNEYYNRFRTTNEGKQRCSLDSNCIGVYVRSCDQREGVHLCRKSYGYEDTSYSCFYKKTSGPTECRRDQFKCNDNSKCISKHTVCDGQPNCEDNSDEAMCGLNFRLIGESPLDMEGTLTGPQPCVSENCTLNAKMRIKFTPGQQSYGLELSLSSHIDQQFFEMIPHLHITTLKGFQFKRVKKLEALLKIDIPTYFSPSNGYRGEDFVPPFGSKADFELKVLGDIPKDVSYGTGKPGTYIFSTSAVITKFGKIMRSLNSEGTKLFVKWDAKDKIVFSDNTLNYGSNYYNIDYSFGFDVVVNPNAFDKLDHLQIDRPEKLFDIKLTDLDRGIEYGRIQALAWQNALRVEYDMSNIGQIRCPYDGRGASKLSLNYRRQTNKTSDVVEFYFETNEFALDDRNGRKNDINECNEVFMTTCNPDVGCWIEDPYILPNLPTSEWKAYRSKINFKMNSSLAVWSDVNPCNKYMIYERKVDVNEIITKLSVEPLFFFGRWFMPTSVYDRKDRSVIIEENIFFKGNGSFDLYHTFYLPDPVSILNSAYHPEAAQFWTSYEDVPGKAPQIRMNMTLFYEMLWYQLASVEMTCPTTHQVFQNSCRIRLESGTSVGNTSPFEKIFDGTFHHSSVIFNNVMVQGIYQYVMEKSILHFMIPGLNYSPLMNLIY